MQQNQVLYLVFLAYYVKFYMMVLVSAFIYCIEKWRWAKYGALKQSEDPKNIALFVFKTVCNQKMWMNQQVTIQ